MGKKRLAALAWVLAALIVARAAPAVEAAPAPAGMMLVSMPSFSRALDALDAFAAAATKDTDREFSPGSVRETRLGRIPLPRDLWDVDAEVRYILPVDVEWEWDLEPALFVRTAGFDSVLRGLQKAGAAIRPEPEGEFLRIDLTGETEFLIADLGDGLVLIDPCANREIGILDALGEWRPGPSGAGLATIDMSISDLHRLWDVVALRPPPPEHELAVLRRELEMLVEFSEGSETAVETFRRCLRAITAATLMYEREKAGMRRATLDIDVDADRLVLSLRLHCDPETLLGGLAAAAAGRDAVGGALIRNAGSDAALVGAVAPLGELVPGGVGKWAEALGMVAEAVVPGAKDPLAAHWREYFAAAGGECVFSATLDGGLVASTTLWTGAKDPEAALEASMGLYEDANRLSEALEAYRGFPLAYAATPGSTGTGKKYWSVRRESPFIPQIAREARKAAREREVSDEYITAFLDTATLLAAGDNVLVMLRGAVAEKDLAARLAAPDGVNEPLWDSDPARAVRKELAHSQIMAALVSHELVLQRYWRAVVVDRMGVSPTAASAVLGDLATAPDMRLLYSAEYRDAIKREPGLFGISLGSDGENPVLDVCIPSAALNMFLYNIGE